MNLKIPQLNEVTKYICLLIIVIIILYQISRVTINREPFTQQYTEHPRGELMNNPEIKQKWSDKTIHDFILFQNTINSQIYFDINIVQNQASEEEVVYLLENGKWPWNLTVQKLYMDAVSINPYIRNNPEDSLNMAMTIYNQNAILQVLKTQTKEGKFLLSGISYRTSPIENTYGYNSGLVSKNDTIIKCEYSNGDYELIKKEYVGDSLGITANHQFKKTKLDYNILEKTVPGFNFINSPCNPCVALNNPSNHSCPFNLKLKPTLNSNNDDISSVWKYLWNL